MMTANPRYAGKPLLRLTECYVLWAIGKLHPKEESSLQAMTPKLNKLYGCDGTWQEVLGSILAISGDATKKIRLLWGKYSEQAALNGLELEPEDFARQFVDQNFNLT